MNSRGAMPTRPPNAGSPATHREQTMRNTLLLYAIRLQFLIQRLLAPEQAARRAGDLFCRPMGSSRTRARQAPTLDAVEHDLDIDGIRIHAYTWGDPSRQPYVLFAHGWSSHGTRIAPWLPHCAQPATRWSRSTRPGTGAAVAGSPPCRTSPAT